MIGFFFFLRFFKLVTAWCRCFLNFLVLFFSKEIFVNSHYKEHILLIEIREEKWR